MALRLLSYDLNQEKTKEDYEGFYSVIKSYSYARLSESSYALDTEDQPETIYALLEPYIDDNDNVMILTLSKPYYGFHRQPVIDWLQAHL